MPDPIPTDDLYARLAVPPDADTPAIDRAWRSLLKQHHPDIAGPVSLELAKLINVAHDWLTDATRRARYDAAIRQRQGRRTGSGRIHRARPAPAPARRETTHEAHRHHAAPSDDLDEVFGAGGPTIRSFLAQAAGLTRNDIDRLTVSDGVDPAADLRDLVPPDLWARIVALDARLLAVCAPAVTADQQASTSARGYGHALVLEPFLWYYLADPEPLLEQMRRGWECAVGLPRYGPNTDEVTALLARLERATPLQARALAAAWDGLGDPLPWPPDAWEFDFAALEVSAALARRDAGRTAALVPAADPAEATRWREAFGSTAHVVTLRPIFPPRAFAWYQRAWGPLGGPVARRTSGEAPRPTVRRA
jgi:hypothetical protein